jgi:hypothetical protein
MVLEVSTLSDEEMKAAGVDPFTGLQVLDNPGIESIIKGGVVHQDAQGRPVISYRQYKELQKGGNRVDNYVLRMIDPASERTVLYQASKYLKAIGMGLEPVEDYYARIGKAPKAEVSGGVKFFRCSTKYPDCERFFDSERSLQTHWGLQHERITKKKEKVNDGQESSG